MRWRSFFSNCIRVFPLPPKPSAECTTFPGSPLFWLVFFCACALFVYSLLPTVFTCLVAPKPGAVTCQALDVPFGISIPIQIVSTRFLLFPLLLCFLHKSLEVCMLLRRAPFFVFPALLRGKTGQRLCQRAEIPADSARHTLNYHPVFPSTRRRFKIAVGRVRFSLHLWARWRAGVLILGRSRRWGRILLVLIA